jgi:hypothetical protein
MVPVDRRRFADVIALIDAEHALDAADHAADRGFASSKACFAIASESTMACRIATPF